jgi:predicted nucleic acid-binding protein
MIVLDTNVVSELSRKNPDSAVQHWFLFAQHDSQIGVSAMTLAELHEGITRQPDGFRKRSLWHDLFDVFMAALRPVVLGFSRAEAERYGEMSLAARAEGEQLSVADAIIAATCLQHCAILATRDRQLLRLSNLSTVNPWTAGQG